MVLLFLLVFYMDRRIIPGLSVEENLILAQIDEPIGWGIERIYDLFPRLNERRNQEGVTLSGREQQMLAVGRALARDVKLLLLDEPYEGRHHGGRFRALFGYQRLFPGSTLCPCQAALQREGWCDHPLLPGR